MLNQKGVEKIKEVAGEFFQKMTIIPSKIEAVLVAKKTDTPASEAPDHENKDVVDLNIKIDEPQILIGEKGQTLFELQRLLRMVLNKSLQEIFYLNLDINDYKKKKVEYLKSLAKDLADDASFSKEERSLLPMSSYERRVIHTELSLRHDVVTESRGEGIGRHIVIRPK